MAQHLRAAVGGYGRGAGVMFYVAKLLQAVGFVYVGYALYLGLSDQTAMGPDTTTTVVGIALFYGGRLLEQRLSA